MWGSLVRRLGAAGAGAALALGALIPAQVVALTVRGSDGTPVTLPTVGPTPTDDGFPTPSPSRTETADPTPEPTPTPLPARLRAFEELATWVDVHDYAALSPRDAARRMRAAGVATVFVQTGRSREGRSVVAGAGPMLEAASAAGLRAVAWYVPDYTNVARDVRRTVDAARFRSGGRRFDAVAIVATNREQVTDRETWMARVAQHVERVRRELGREQPIAVVTEAPTVLQDDAAWSGFPWDRLARAADVVVVNAYWTTRDCGTDRDECAGPFTRRNVELAQTRAGLPVHVAGGFAGSATAAQVRAFRAAASAAGAIGWGLYDFRTTDETAWRALEEGTS